jgi:hypothetical protein
MKLLEPIILTGEVAWKELKFGSEAICGGRIETDFNMRRIIVG